MAGTHENQTKNHRPHTWEFANAAARVAFTGYTAPTVDDVGKWALQLDTTAFFYLSDNSPITWIEVVSSATPADGSITLAQLAFDPATQAELNTHAAIDANQTVHGHTNWEMIQDMVASLLVAGSNITLTYDDTTNTITIAASGVSAEEVDDRVASLLVAGTNVALVYDDGANALTINVSGAGPTGAAGGVLSGTYPNPGFASDMATQAELDTAIASEVTNRNSAITTHAGIDATQTAHGHASFEMIQDMLSSALIGGAGVTITYDDTANTISFAAVGFANPMTTAGDLILGGSSGTATRLAKGTDSYVLTIDPTTHLPVWAVASGGGSSPITTDGDLIYGDSGGTDTRLPVGADGDVLTVTSGLPSWSPPSDSGIGVMTNPMTTGGDLIFGSTGSGLTDVAQGVTATASVSAPANPPSYAVDGNDTSFWTTNLQVIVANTGWLHVDLVTPHMVNRARVHQYDDSNYYPTNYIVQGSDDDSTWTDFVTGTSASGRDQTHNFTGESHRYWRVYSTTIVHDWAIYTFSLFNSTVGAPQRLPIGTSGQVLTVVSGVPTWV